MNRTETKNSGSDIAGKHLSPLAAWALSFGYADNGREALEALTAPDAPTFDFVLTDAWMPEMTGMELVAEIRANPVLADLPVYLFTAEVEMQDTYAENGFNGILLKPANLEALKQLLP